MPDDVPVPAHVAIVGGGITGLATAWYLTNAQPPVTCTVLESSSRWGGKIFTSAEPAPGGGQFIIEHGPDSVLRRKPWAADLMRELEVSCEVDFMAISSYGSSTDSSGVVRILKDLDESIKGRDVLVVEDIIDSGLTLSYLLRTLRARQPRSLEVCALLTKPTRRKIEINCQYVGFEIPADFVIGYGLDFAEKYRNLPYVGVLREELTVGAS